MPFIDTLGSMALKSEARKTPLGGFHEEPLRACVGLVPHTLRARFGF